MKKYFYFIFSISIFIFCFNVYSETNSPKKNFQGNAATIEQQLQELMKARADMIRSLMDDSSFDNFDKHFEDIAKQFELDPTSGFGNDQMGDVVGEYDWRENETHKIFVLNVKQIKDKPLDIKIEKGQIKLKGDVESVNSDKASKRVSRVHFERTFEIPEGVDQATPDFLNNGAELLIRFKKIHPATTKSLPQKSISPSKSPPKSLNDERIPVGKDSGDVSI